MLNEKIDVRENNIYRLNSELVSILLIDRTTKKNIRWATNNYEKRGAGYQYDDEIIIERIVGYNGLIIRPRVKKSSNEKNIRIKEKAEVFTPSWVCNKQNNLIDREWFGYDPKFNEETEFGWIPLRDKIIFDNERKWEDYIKDIRLEVSCGEAPYLVSRYDTVTGDIIDVLDRIGLLDRKCRIINENTCNLDDWLYWMIEAFKSVYGYEWQGDNLLIARENLLYTFIDNYKYKFNEEPTIELLKEIALIISWNIWQMDGMKYVIPDSCKNYKIINNTIFGEEVVEKVCNGCKKNNILTHNGIYAKIMNWNTGRAIKYLTVVNRSVKNE